MDAVIRERPMILVHLIGDPAEPAGGRDEFHIREDELAQLHCCLSGCESEREGFDGVDIEEDEEEE